MNFTNITESQFDIILQYINTYQHPNYAQTILNSLAECNCCYTHQQNKPIIFSPLCEHSYSSNSSTSIKNCTCPCRHMSRQICKLYPSPQTPIKLNNIKIYTSPPKLKKQYKHFSSNTNNDIFPILLQM